MEITVTVNGSGARGRRRAADAARPRDPGGRSAHRHAHRVRHLELRRVHGAARRRAGEVLHDVRRAGRRPRGHDGRGPDRGRRARPDPGGVQGGARPAVRLLHAGHDARRRRRCSSENPDPSDDDVRWAISGNICRCTGYMNIVKAIQAAAAEDAAATGRRAGRGLSPRDGARSDDGDRSRQRSAGSATASSARRTTASSAARATTSTTSMLPGMLHMAILRSPYAHAKINGDRHVARAARCPAWSRS